MQDVSAMTTVAEMSWIAKLATWPRSQQVGACVPSWYGHRYSTLVWSVYDMTGTPKPAHRHTETCPAPTVKDSPSVRLCAGLHSQHWVKHELGGRGGNTIWISQTRLVAGEKTEQTDVIGTSHMHPIEGVDTETWQTQQLWFSSPTINSSFLKSLRCTVISSLRFACQCSERIGFGLTNHSIQTTTWQVTTSQNLTWW